MLNPEVRKKVRQQEQASSGSGNPLLDLIPKESSYDLGMVGSLAAGAFDTPYADGRVRISRGVGLTSPLQELRIFERIGGEEKKVYASWQEEEDALAEAAARGEELAAIDDRWQEGGFDEAEAMDFDGDYDDDGGMPDS